MSYPSISRAALRGLGLLLVVTLVLPTSVVAQEAPIKIAVVDLELVVTQSAAGRALQKELEAFSNSVQAEGEGMAGGLSDLRQRLADGANSLAEERLVQLQKEVEDAQIALQRFQGDKEREGQKIQGEGLREIEKQLKPVFDQIRDEQGIDIILNNVPGVVVMAGKRVDITRLIIERFDASLSSDG